MKKKIIDLLTKITHMFQQILANQANLIKAGYKSNAFAPLVWFNAVANPSLIIGACYTNDIALRYLLGILAALIIAVSLIAYIVLLIKSPTLLQSESFRIEDKKLDLIAQKGTDVIMINPVDLTPQPLQIEKEGGKND
ncbi:MAG: hypothetical protein IPP32_13065 [Bacteroidetes bacterium]|nr:hypothetical protein [Bacteroidota bacterium]